MPSLLMINLSRIEMLNMVILHMIKHLKKSRILLGKELIRELEDTELNMKCSKRKKQNLREDKMKQL